MGLWDSRVLHFGFRNETIWDSSRDRIADWFFYERWGRSSPSEFEIYVGEAITQLVISTVLYVSRMKPFIVSSADGVSWGQVHDWSVSDSRGRPVGELEWEKRGRVHLVAHPTGCHLATIQLVRGWQETRGRVWQLSMPNALEREMRGLAIASVFWYQRNLWVTTPD